MSSARTQALTAALKTRYHLPEWVLLAEARSTSGHDNGPIADALAISTYPSRNHAILGFEVKTDRGDWLRELKDPGKADAVARYCDEWWLVIDDEAIIKNTQVPELWGVLCLVKEKFKVLQKPTKLEPLPWPRNFIATCLRNAMKADDRDRQSAIEAEVNRRMATERERHVNMLTRAQESTEYWRGVSDEIRKVIGHVDLKQFIQENPWFPKYVQQEKQNVKQRAVHDLTRELQYLANHEKRIRDLILEIQRSPD